MPKTVNEVFRDHVRYTGDGLPGEPVGRPLPIGDPSSGVHHPTKADMRKAMGGAFTAAARAEEAVAEVLGAVYSTSTLSALLAQASTFPVGTIFQTRAEGFSYEVVASGGDLTTAGGVSLRVLPINGEYHVDAFGTGTADDTAAFQKAIDALPAEGGRIRLSSSNYAVPGALSVGSKKVEWVGSGLVNGAAAWALPGRREGYAPTIGRTIYQDHSNDVTYTSRDNQRNASYSGGNSGQLTFLERWYTTIQSSVGAAGQHRAEKAGLFGVENNSPNANGIGLMVQGRGKSTGAIWALESNTYSDVIPTVRAHRSAEFNIHATGRDVHNLRWIVDIVSHSADAVTYDPNANVYAGLVVNAGSADMINGAVFKDRPSGGKIKNAVLLADTDADIIEGIAKTVSGKIKLGSHLRTGVVANLLGQGENSDGEMINYSEIRSLIVTGTKGAEDGAVHIGAMSAGAYTALMTLTGTAGNSVAMRVGGTLKQVEQGPTDSAGTGYRQLRVAN